MYPHMYICIHAIFSCMYSDDYDSELIADDDSKPLTQDELKNKVMKLVSSSVHGRYLYLSVP